MKNVEIEIQLNIENSKRLIEFLRKNAEFKSEERQTDEYFIPSHRNFVEVRPVREWLRLRKSDGKQYITYKKWHLDKDKRSHYCDEYSTDIGDLSQIKKILNVLDFKSLIKVKKVRKTWIYKNYKFALDSVRGLGDFVEVEYIGEERRVEPDKIIKGMIKLLKDIKCGKIKGNYVGYPFQLLFPDEVKYEEL